VQSTAWASQAEDLGLPIVAPEAQPTLHSEAEARPTPNDARWLHKPLTLGLSAVLGFPQAANPFLLPGAELDYALPYVSIGGTFGYLDGINASVVARGRLHLGHALALTLGARGALLPLSNTCWFDFGQSSESCTQKQHWEHTFFGGGELAIEGRSEAGFIWRAGFGFWGLVAHGDGSCTRGAAALSCSTEPSPGVVQTEELALGWAL
jgi:hypothetical protein